MGGVPYPRRVPAGRAERTAAGFVCYPGAWPFNPKAVTGLGWDVCLRNSCILSNIKQIDFRTQKDV